MTTAPLPTTVTIEHWLGVDPRTGRQGANRWSIVFEGQVLLTYPTELECRRKCREMGWVVRAAGMLA